MAEIISPVNGFIQASQYRIANRADPNVIVIHRMENPDKPNEAIAVGRWFASKQSPVASTHYGVDPGACIQYVLEKDVAYGAPGMNRYGIHIEHAGWSKENDWDSENGKLMLALSGQLSADICSRNAIQLKWLTDSEIVAASKGDITVRGFCTHADVTRALQAIGVHGTHQDPGSSFPRDQYLQLVQKSLFDVT